MTRAARRPDLATRRALALGLPLLSVLGLRGLEWVRRAQGSPARGRGEGRVLATAILLRHAEKDPGADPSDPGLSGAGRKRAQALSRLLARAGVSHLFASEFHRTRETLEPLAQAGNLKVEIVRAANTAELAARIEALPVGSVSVVAGHSNTIPALAQALGGEIANLESTPQGPALSEKDYGRLFVVTLGPEIRGEAPVGEPPAGNPPGKLPVKRDTAVLELAYGE